MIVAEEKSGFVHHFVADGDRGQVSQESFQYGPSKKAGGILLPTLVLEVYYGGKETVSLLDVYQVVKAECNQELPADAFVVGVPKGTNVVDFRLDRAKPKWRVTTEAVKDVIKFIGTRVSVGEREGGGVVQKMLWGGVLLGGLTPPHRNRDAPAQSLATSVR